MFTASAIIKKNGASRKWLRHSERRKTFQVSTDYKHLVPTER
jgi:hypothetical protein